jgi:hypothetical protein
MASGNPAGCAARETAWDRVESTSRTAAAGCINWRAPTANSATIARQSQGESPRAGGGFDWWLVFCTVALAADQGNSSEFSSRMTHKTWHKPVRCRVTNSEDFGTEQSGGTPIRAAGDFGRFIALAFPSRLQPAGQGTGRTLVKVAVFSTPLLTLHTGRPI